jgi:DNA-binding CsgD family transcriptional regulator
MSRVQHIRRIRYERRVEVSIEAPSDSPSWESASLAGFARRQMALRLEQGRDLHFQPLPSIASEVYQGVLSGRWVITDHFEDEARRFLIAEPCQIGDGRALTERERQVLELALQGHSNKFIGLDLGLTPSTVATHLRRTMTKLGVDSRETLIQALLLAWKGSPSLSTT